MLVCRRRIFANRVIRLWVEDSPELWGINICAHDEAFGGSGRLFLSDEQLRHAFRHFARGRLGGFGADLAMQGCSVQEHPPICVSHLMEVALTEELVASLLDAVCFEVNGLGDEWFIYLPGFGKARAEVPQGPALRVASATSSGIGRRRPQSAGRSLPGRPQSAGGVRQGGGCPTRWMQAQGPPPPLGNRLTSLMDQERARGHHPLGEPITGEDDPSEASRHTEDWHGCDLQGPSRPSSAGRRPWIPPGVPKCLEPAPLLSNPTPSPERRSPRRAVRGRDGRAVGMSRSKLGNWPGRHMAPAVGGWMSEVAGDDFSRGPEAEEPICQRAW